MIWMIGNVEEDKESDGSTTDEGDNEEEEEEEGNLRMLKIYYIVRISL